MHNLFINMSSRSLLSTMVANRLEGGEADAGSSAPAHHSSDEEPLRKPEKRARVAVLVEWTTVVVPPLLQGLISKITKGCL